MNVTIIGLGLIGGSLALSLRQHGLVERLIGVEQNPAHARRAYPTSGHARGRGEPARRRVVTRTRRARILSPKKNGRVAAR